MAVVGDVFGLNSVYDKQVENVDNNNFASWPESATYGYFGGGAVTLVPSTSTSIITRLDFSNETVSDPGNNLSSTIREMGKIASSYYGYFAGGRTPAFISTITRLDFSNETVSDPGNNLPTARSESAGTSTNYYGYFVGGNAPPSISTITRLDFSNETASDPGNNLPTARSSTTIVSNNFYGYAGGGLMPPNTSIITRIDFSNETVSDPGNNLPSNISDSASVSNVSYGYFGGGENPSATNIITKFDFSNETVSNPGKDLPSNRTGVEGSSSISYGYIGGGFNPVNPPYYVSTISRLDFSTETVSDPGNNLPTGRGDSAAVSGGQSTYRAKGFKTYGYFTGGFPPPSRICTISRLDFSNDTVSDPGKSLPAARSNSEATSSNSYGYFVGGTSPTSTPIVINTITRLDFSNETLSDPGNNLSTVKNTLTATSSNSYGYFAGGSPTSSTITRLDFSNETLSNPGNNLPAVRRELAATSSNSYGYFGGGQDPTSSPTAINTISRLDFTNETISDPGNNLPTSRYYFATTSSNFYGYFGGGREPISSPTVINTITRLDFSNETISDPGNNLPTVRTQLAATSSNSCGYFGGGFTGTFINTISRLDFTNETTSDPGNNLPTATGYLSAVSNSN